MGLYMGNKTRLTETPLELIYQNGVDAFERYAQFGQDIPPSIDGLQYDDDSIEAEVWHDGFSSHRFNHERREC